MGHETSGGANSFVLDAGGRPGVLEDPSGRSLRPARRAGSSPPEPRPRCDVHPDGDPRAGRRLSQSDQTLSDWVWKTRHGQLARLAGNRKPVTDPEAEVSRLTRELAEARLGYPKSSRNSIIANVFTRQSDLVGQRNPTGGRDQSSASGKFPGDLRCGAGNRRYGSL